MTKLEEIEPPSDRLLAAYVAELADIVAAVAVAASRGNLFCAMDMGLAHARAKGIANFARMRANAPESKTSRPAPDGDRAAR